MTRNKRKKNFFLARNKLFIYFTYSLSFIIIIIIIVVIIPKRIQMRIIKLTIFKAEENAMVCGGEGEKGEVEERMEEGRRRRKWKIERIKQS